MMDNGFQTSIIRKSLIDDELILITGFYVQNYEDGELKVLIDNKEIDFEKNTVRGSSVKAKYAVVSSTIDTEENLSIRISKNLVYNKLTVEFWQDDEKQKALEYTKKELEEIINKPNYCMDRIDLEKGEYTLTGWVVYKDKADVYICDSAGKKLDGKLTFNKRSDVRAAYPELSHIDNMFGFKYEFKVKSKDISVVIEADGDSVKENIDLKNGIHKKKNILTKAIEYSNKFGKKALIKKVVYKFKNKFIQPSENIDYNEWAKKRDVSERNLEKQRKMVFDKKPKFSIVVPLYNTPINYLNELIASVKEQTYSNWELCFADGSDNDMLIPVFDELMKADCRIRYKKLEDNKGISENTNAALELATGDYIVLADHDDLLTPDALFEFVKAINEDDKFEVLYSDEDKISMDGSKRFQPHFKPDFNIDLLCSVNYICHLFAVKKSIVDEIGGFRSEFDGAQDYDFIFRCVENAKKVYHVPRVLYHWRSHINSTAENPESKLYAFTAGKNAIKEHFNRIGLPATVTDGPAYGLYHSKIEVVGNPKVSILIPNKDHIDDLDKCIQSIYGKTLYKNFEIIIIENNSTEEATFSYYKDIEAKYDGVKVVFWKDEFNYSAINNFGAEYATGEYLLCLNNDVEVINDTWLEEMLGYCQREDVGIVGARLFYPDDTIQHAGVVIGYGGIAGHTFIGQARDDFGYFARAMLTQDYSAVTAACMMTKKSVFDEVGGFDINLKVAFNDIDYCMKVRNVDKLVVYNANATLYHYESKSRGMEDTPEKIERFNGEIEKFRAKWPEILEKGDPFYNPNLSLDRSDFALKQ